MASKSPPPVVSDATGGVSSRSDNIAYELPFHDVDDIAAMNGDSDTDERKWKRLRRQATKEEHVAAQTKRKPTAKAGGKEPPQKKAKVEKAHDEVKVEGDADDDEDEVEVFDGAVNTEQEPKPGPTPGPKKPESKVMGPILNFDFGGDPLVWKWKSCSGRSATVMMSDPRIIEPTDEDYKQIQTMAASTRWTPRPGQSREQYAKQKSVDSRRRGVEEAHIPHNVSH